MGPTRMSRFVGILGLTAVISVVGDGSAICLPTDVDATYPGTMCRFYGAATLDGFFSVTGGGTSLRNTSTVTQSITCPLAAETTYRNDRMGFTFAEISLSGTGYAASACGVHATSWNGASTFVAPTPTVNVSGSKSDFVWGTSCTLAPGFSSFAITCDIKPNSLVYKYEFISAADR